VVQAGSGPGDSGSPVFETTSDPHAVIFDGVLSGGYTNNGNQYFWYSSVTRIKTELSGPNVHDLTFIHDLVQK
jgi:V8-like Glu-specific endopeptidase